MILYFKILSFYNKKLWSADFSIETKKIYYTECGKMDRAVLKVY